jgi:S-adenosylmethionine:tRNA ribosyltransferase-isomerase
MDDASDAERYQTVYAQNAGSVAAPTAGLHFTPGLLTDLENRGIALHKIELHVGAGTFRPIDSEDVRDHTMHAEEVHVPKAVIDALRDGAPTLAVGTTSSRSLESAYWLAVESLHTGAPLGTHLPQWTWQELAPWWDAQPGSETEKRQKAWNHALAHWPSQRPNWTFTTALMMVPGYRVRTWDALLTNFHQPGSTLLMLVASVLGDAWKSVYDHALSNNYRFLSYGDASLLWRK